MKNSILLALVFALFGCAVSIPENWPTFADENFSFRYPADFESEFVVPVEWPPTLEIREQKFACEGGEIRDEFCVRATSEGAAGSAYTTFEYSRELENQTLAFTFTLREPRCPNYSEPKMSACEREQKSLDLDALLAKIFTTLKFRLHDR